MSATKILIDSTIMFAVLCLAGAWSVMMVVLLCILPRAWQAFLAGLLFILAAITLGLTN